MRGVSASAVSALLIIIAVASGALIQNFMTRVSSEAQSRGETALVDARKAPKPLALACFGDYGYLRVSSDVPLRGKVLYEVEYGLDEVSSGFADVNLSDVGKIYFNASMAEGSDYHVTITSKYWKLRDECRSTRHPGLALFIPFNESSGTTAKDWSLNENDASVNDSWVNGTSDYAVHFNGTQFGKIPAIPDSKKFTLSFWAIRDSVDEDNEAFVEGPSFYARSQSDGTIDLGVTGGEISLDMPNQTWVNYILRYDGSRLSVFRNCSIVQTLQTQHTPSPGPLIFGKGTNYVAGAIDEVYYYTSSLPNDEVEVFCPNQLDVQDDAYNGTETGGPFI